MIQRKRVQNPFAFVYDIYKYGKFSELVSFAVWELLHKLRLFPKAKYLQLTNSGTLTLAKEKLDHSDFSAKLDRFFSSRALSIVRCDHSWKVLFTTNDGELFGCVYPDDTDLYKSVDNGESIIFVKRFPERIKSIFVSRNNTIFVCVEGAVYRSSNNGESFAKVLDLGSSVSFFRHNNGMTETPDGALIIAEYGNVWTDKGWQKLAYLYLSADNGETWHSSDFLIKGGTNKHVHLVKYSRLFNKIFMADGDNYKKLWVSDALTAADLQDADRWEPVTRFHIQTGGYTSVVESDKKILFGTDYQGGTNFIVESATGRTFTKRIVPDPYRRSPIMNMVQRKSRSGTEIWAYLPYSTARTKSLFMYTSNGGDSWNKVIEYNGATHKIWLINASNHITDVLYFSIEDVQNGERIVYKVGDQERRTRQGKIR
jgi:hypothetical protein